jgi:MoaA/NifB/PqqE/SkfB family radical SAM enzyme
MRTLRDNAAKFLRLLCRRRSAYPEEIQVEVTNACNLACSMCPHTHGGIPERHFSLEVFQRLVTENPAPRRLVLTGWGEPLLHPEFFEMVQRANRHWRTASVRFTTNGILLNEETREKMRHCELAAVTVSVDLWHDSRNWRPELRDLLHPPSPKTFRNLEDYAADPALSRKTPLVLQMVLLRENLEDIRNYIGFAAEHRLSAINLVRMQLYPGTAVERLPWEEEQRLLQELIGEGSARGVTVRTVNRQNLGLRLATHGDRVCLRTDDSLYITFDGTCTPCCNLRTYGIGALPEHTVAEIWNSERERNFFADQSAVCGKCDALFHRYR